MVWSAPAIAEDWRAVVVAGLVEQRTPGDPNGEWQPVTPGNPLLLSTQIRTGDNGRLTAARGVSVMEFSPNSQAELREIEPTGLRTTIFQTLGRILFRVEKQNVRHFRVRTPYLVAAVKGTVFSVDVGPTGASVSVSEGVVGVSKDGGSAANEVDVTPGQTATASATPGSAISVTTEGAPVAPTTPATPATPSKGVTGSTQGLAAAPSVDSSSGPGQGGGQGAEQGGGQGAGQGDGQGQGTAGSEGSEGSGQIETGPGQGQGQGQGNGQGGGNGGGNGGGQGGGSGRWQWRWQWWLDGREWVLDMRLPTVRAVVPHVAIGAVVAAHYVFGALDFLEYRLADLRYRLTPRTATSELVIVAIDAESIAEVGTWPWPRSLHARAVERLYAAGARQIALDIDFSSRSTPGEDAALAGALKS